MRGEVQRLLRARGWSWTELAQKAQRATGRDVLKAFYLVRNGERAASASMVDQMVAGFGALPAGQVRRLHIAGALDAGFRIGEAE